MWNRARVTTGSLQALAALNRLSRRYQIDKIQRLSANFERACWRSVRCAEEAAYHRKYDFLRHCVNVINYRKSQPKTRVVPLSDFASTLAAKYNGDNADQLKTEALLRIKTIKSQLPKCIRDVDTDQLTTDEIVDMCRKDDLSTESIENAICSLVEISNIQRLLKRFDDVRKKDISDPPYTRVRLEAMARRGLTTSYH
ncbi:uncharacterized protein BBOV_IV003950 [Babesia bovis T2Bo]|uniref:Uncharacterized protein n=1 Tax=Babesia bovis TaxID=5865 RepID=A7AQD7_BABBO|nr:uncharacterized protein BBOV_IV003950 [Babesia bovis T2Bo]EDO06756.1 hypothetical protein BBOV_IV003950 [Babesia bovis T2Bo]|eukprot:XP_001610324.1 hypothetical protein [Babesia bovis T2Bo]